MLMKAKTLQELRKEKNIKVTEISKVMSRQTYYYWLQWKTEPSEKVLKAFLDLFEIDEKTFRKLLKKSITKS